MNLQTGMRRMFAAITAVAMLMAIVAPGVVYAATAADDLKQIEYKYYFRGKYQQAIEALQTYLARVDLSTAEVTRAREFLAASYVLAGAPDMGKEVFTRIIAASPAYAGPDPGVFKLEVMDAYAKARSEYAALTIRSVPETAMDAETKPAVTPAQNDDRKKPIYKQWWLYAGVAAVAIAVGAAAGGDGGGSDTSPTGSVVVGVNVR